MNKNYPLGAIPSPSDSRDWHLSRLIAPKAMTVQLPEEFCHPIPPIKNQLAVGCCVAESLGTTRDIKECEQDPHGNFYMYSTEWIYGNRGFDGFQYTDENGTLWGDYEGSGMVTRIALARLKKYGVPRCVDVPTLRLVEWQEAQTQVKAIYNETLPKALPHRITGYARLYTPEEIKLAVYTLGAVTIMISCWNWYIDENYILHPTNEPVTGYHEVTIIGWRKDGTFIVVNSWGEEWGDHGLCYIPFDYPLVEAWSITDDILPEPEPLPEPIPEPEPKLNIFERILIFFIKLFSK